MMTDPATAIKREVFQLVELQIETLRQEGRLSDSALIEYHTRSEKITELYHEIDRVVRARFDWRSVTVLGVSDSTCRLRSGRPGVPTEFFLGSIRAFKRDAQKKANSSVLE